MQVSVCLTKVLVAWGTLVQPKITIINQTSQPVQAESEWDGNELKVILTEMQKQNEAMIDQKISKSWRDAARQGGPLSR